MSDRDQQITGSVRRIYEAFDRGDFDTAIELAHPDIELIPPGGQAPLRGAGAVRAWMEPETMVDRRDELKELRVNGDTALVLHNTRATGAASGIELDVDTWDVWTLDGDGLVTRVEVFLPHEKGEAFEAAGMLEQG